MSWTKGNFYHGDLDKPGAVYCGRPYKKHGLEGSILQNPFKSRIVGSREEAIRRFDLYLKAHWKVGPDRSPIARELLRLAQAPDGILVCFCAPKSCHTDVLIRAIDWVRVHVLGKKEVA